MKTVSMVVKISVLSETKEKTGNYVTMIYYHLENRTVSKRLYGEYTGTTANRMIIVGVTEGIRALKEPCVIKLKTSTPFGLRKIEDSIIKNKLIKGTNADLLEELRDEIVRSGSKIELTVGPVTSDKKTGDIR